MKTEKNFNKKNVLIVLFALVAVLFAGDSFAQKQKSRSVIHIVDDNGKSIRIEKENDKITFLEVDGRRIPENEYDNYKARIDEVMAKEAAVVRRETDIRRQEEDMKKR